MEQEKNIDIEPVVEELITHIESTVDTFLEPSNVAETSVIETLIIETPLVETRVKEEYQIVETPVIETPVIEIPIVETPIIETPVIETPVIEIPIVETPVIETPVIEIPIVETPVEIPIIETPIIETPIIETPIIETPIIETPVTETVKVTNHNSGWAGWFSRLFFSNKEAPIIIEKTPEKELPIMEDVSISLVEPPVSINDVTMETISEIKNENTVLIEETKIIKSAFILAIESVLDSTEKQEKYIIKTDDDMKILLQKLIQTKTTVFDSIELTIKNIVSNVSVDSKDIPNLMLLLVEIYEFAFQMKNKNNIIDLCGKTLKFCINVIIEEKIIQNENTTDFIINTHNLIDTGVNLIKLNKKLKKKGKGKGKHSLSAIVFELFCNKNTK